MGSAKRMRLRTSVARLPPLKSIQAFEAAARHLSFKLAAEELCVTPTAVSHQVKALEDHFGVKLFHRLTRSLRLTSEGEAYVPLVRQAFENLAEASHALGSDEVEGEIVISTTTSLASNWLGPRLPSFRERFPDLVARVLGSDGVSEFSRDGVHVAIRYGFGNYPDLHVAWVLDDLVTPVCAPDFPMPRDDASALLAAPLINYEWLGYSDNDPSWAKWFHAAGIETKPPKETVTYSDEHVCLQAAIDGQGVALVSLIAAARALDGGQLVAPYGTTITNKSYYLVCPVHQANTAKVAAFQDWLLEQADLFRDSEIGARFFSA